VDLLTLAATIGAATLAARLAALVLAAVMAIDRFRRERGGLRECGDGKNGGKRKKHNDTLHGNSPLT
jgi:hypothetical protein